MLVLSRKKHESIMIGDEIEIKIVAVEGDVVRLGIEAPKHVEVHRKEVYEAIKEENEQALQHKADWSLLKQMLGKQAGESDGE